MYIPRAAVFANALCLGGVLASHVVARDTMSNHVETSSALPQELGSTTESGYFVYTVNYCTIVRETACETGLSTGGIVPTDWPGPNQTASTSSEAPTTSSAQDTSGAGSPSEPTSSSPGGDDDTDGASVAENGHAYLYGIAGVAAAVLV